MSIIIPDSVDHALEKALTPLATNVGNTVADLWFLMLGSISQNADIRRIKYQNEKNKLLEESSCRVSEIPEEDLKEPNVQVALQALTQAQYCVEEETLRKMFAELIASTMMKSRENVVHPSFPTLLSQMSSEDANALLRFKDTPVLPIISIISPKSDGSYYKLITDVWERCEDLNTYAHSQMCLISLARLGLIEISYNEWSGDPAMHEALLTEQLKERAILVLDPMDRPGAKLTIQRGHIELTRLGHNFISCVAPQ